jgi:zinc protease
MFRKLLWCAVVLAASPAWAEYEVKSVSLGHGVEAWYATDEHVPVVDVQISFEGAGSASDPDGKGGRAALAAALLNEGAGTLGSAAFHRALEQEAISLNAQADQDRLVVHVHCLRDSARRAGELLTMALAAPQFAEPDVARMKTEIRSLQRQLQESGGYQASRLLAERAFRGTSYANPPYGTPESIESVGAADLRDYMKSLVTRGNVKIAAAGDVDSRLLDGMLGAAVDALPVHAELPPPPKTEMLGAGEHARATLPLPQTVVAFMAPAVPRHDPRFYTAFLLNRILGGDPLDARLSVLRREGGLVYNAGTALDVRLGGVFIGGQLATRNRSAEEATARAKAVLRQIHDGGVTEQECDDAKNYVRGAFPLQLDSSRSMASMILRMQYLNLGRDYLDRRDGLFEKIGCADINALARELLAPERFLFATVGGTVDGPEPVSPPSPGDTR